MGTVGQMGNTAVNVVFKLIDLLRWLSEQRARDIRLMSGETDMASLQKFLDHSRDGKGTVSMPRSELEMFKAQAASHGVSYVIADGGDSNTVDVTFAKGRDGEAISQIIRNMAQIKLNESNGKWATDRDLNGIDPQIADRVFRKNDIEQFSFVGAEGRFTIYNRDMEEAYLLSKNEARTLTSELNGITVQRVNDFFFSALDSKSNILELDKNEAQALNFLLDRDKTDVRFYQDGEKVLMSFNPSVEHDILNMRFDYKAAQDTLSHYNISYNNGINIENMQTGQTIKPFATDALSMSKELSYLSDNPLFSYCMMERINDTLFNSDDIGARYAMHSFGFDNMKREIYFDKMSDIAGYKENSALANELRLAENLSQGSVKNGILIFDRTKNKYAIVPETKALETMSETFGYDRFKSGILRDRADFLHDLSNENTLHDFESNNPLLRNCKYDISDNQMFIVNNVNDKVMWINFGENIPRADIEKGIADKLGITDKTAIAEMMAHMDRDGYIPAPVQLHVDNRYTVSMTTKDFVTISDNDMSVHIAKTDVTPERIAHKLHIEKEGNKTLLDTLCKACNPPESARAYKSFARHIEDASKAIAKERKKLSKAMTKEIEGLGERS
jgi:hypothetical protein